MGAGEYVSMRAQKELYEYEIDVERHALATDPVQERVELRDIFIGRGIDPELAERLSVDLMRDPEMALRTHAREELGVDPSAVGSPWIASSSSFAFFSLGAFIPLLPWLVTSGGNPLWWSIGVAGAAIAAVGGAVGRYTHRGVLRPAIRQLLICGCAAAVTFGVGHLVGVH
jgi:VIT1/CCC1 family predicted Fe2+/Mn2+ transporter